MEDKMKTRGQRVGAGNFGLSPDLEDVLRRSARRNLWRRVRAGTAGGVVGITVIAVLVANAGVQRLEPLDRESSTVLGSTGFETLPSIGEAAPEGTMVWRDANDLVVLTASSDEPRALEAPVNPYDVSPNGSEILATLGTQEDGGSYRQTSIVSIDVDSGATRTLVTGTNSQGFTGPIAYSPDGRYIAFRQVEWPHSPDGGFAGEPISDLPCVLLLDNRSEQCFDQVAGVRSLSWLADSSGLVVSGGPGVGIGIIEMASSSVEVLVTSDLTPELVTVVQETGVKNPTDVQFADVAASPDGVHVAAMLLVHDGSGFVGSILVVYDGKGRLLAHGSLNLDLSVMAWSPQGDVIAYSAGIVGIQNPAGLDSGVLLLNPSTGDQRVMLDTSDKPNVPGEVDPFVLNVAWSPSGEWVAAQGRDEIWVASRSGQQSRLVAFGDDGALVGWES
jgi:WD40 repeat protein